MTLTVQELLSDANKILKRRKMGFVLAGTFGRGSLTFVDQNHDQTVVIEGGIESIKIYLASFTTGFRIGATK